MGLYDRSRRKPEKNGHRVVRSSNVSGKSIYEFARNGSVPEGEYHAKLDYIKGSKTNSNNDAVDVFYTLQGKEKKHKIVQRIAEGYYLECYYDQLLDAGVTDGVLLEDLQNFDVTVEVSYDRNGFAKIEVKPSKQMERKRILLEADEDDDLLEDE